MKIMVSNIYMSVQHVLHKVNLIHISRKIVVIQKTTRVFPTRTVYSNTKHKGQSTSWKHDWLFNNKCSFAEVLLRNIKKTSKVWLTIIPNKIFIQAMQCTQLALRISDLIAVSVLKLKYLLALLYTTDSLHRLIYSVKRTPSRSVVVVIHVLSSLYKLTTMYFLLTR